MTIEDRFRNMDKLKEIGHMFLQVVIINNFYWNSCSVSETEMENNIKIKVMGLGDMTLNQKDD